MTQKQLLKPVSELSLSGAGRTLRRHFERDHPPDGSGGLEGVPKYEAYQCSADVWTMGEGCTTYVGESGKVYRVKKGQHFDLETIQRTERFHEQQCQAIIEKHVGVKLSQNEIDALHSLVWNFGEAFFWDFGSNQPTNTKKIINSGDRLRAAHQFTKWRKEEVNGAMVDNRGLYRRRCAEALMWLNLPWFKATTSDRVTLNTKLTELTRFAREQVAPVAPEPRPEKQIFDPRESDGMPKDIRPPKPEPEPVTKPKHPNSCKPEDVPYGITEKELKPIEDSDRGKAYGRTYAGGLLQWLGSVAAFPATVLVSFIEALKPVLPWLLTVGLIVLAAGWLLTEHGKRLRRKGEREASQGLY